MLTNASSNYLDFQSLAVWIKKASNLINKEGVPGAYISMLIQLEDLVKQTQADKEVWPSRQQVFLATF